MLVRKEYNLYISKAIEENKSIIREYYDSKIVGYLEILRLAPRRIGAGFKLLNPPRSEASSYLRLGELNLP